MKRFILVSLLSLLMIGSASAVTVTASSGTASLSTSSFDGNYINYVKISWTSTSGGAVTATISGLIGEMVAFQSAPVASASPSSNYDITLIDEASYDILAGGGANRSATTTERVAGAFGTYFQQPVAGTHTLGITNAGNAKQGTVYIWVRKRGR